jgi:protoheme IX farnesyltransferase
MAIVVSPRVTAEAQPGLPQAGLTWARLAAGLRWLTPATAAWYALALVADSAARALLPDGALAATLHAVSVIAILLTVGACAAAWLVRRDNAALLLATTLAATLVAVRALATALLLTIDLSTLADVADIGLGLLVLGCLVWAATTQPAAPATLIAAAGEPRAVRVAGSGARAELFRRVAEVTALVVLVVGLSGVTVRAVGASWACSGDFPDCNGLGILPFGRDPLADIQLYHRLLAYVALALVAWVTIEAFRTQRDAPGIPRASLVLFGTTALQGAIGAASVSLLNPPVTQIMHMAGAAASWSAAVVLVAFAHRTAVAPSAAGAVPSSVPLTPALSPSGAREFSTARTLSAYVQLTKPRVMSLLLATTATAMVIAARGMPDVGLFIATLVGGALMSGGAGAINHYVDRDIDPLMGRTAWRPIPSGVISPRRALWFGIALGIIASAIFILFVNPLACLLALIGLLGYVFIYTLWLKRSTPSNIVIGGAAGAIPPLVGWAAVTNEIGSLTAWYLFAIIFFWTPPHFWALSLLIRKHYERAGIPMLPVVRGEDETRRQIVLYSVLLVVLTLVLSPFGMMGGVYFAAAVVLGGLFIRDALGLWRQATPQAARRLYLYSILYLFALFAAMAVDRVVTAH